MCMVVLSPMDVCAPHAFSVYGGQKKKLDPLDLELQMVLSHHMGAGNQILVVWKRSQSLTTEPFPSSLNSLILK